MWSLIIELVNTLALSFVQLPDNMAYFSVDKAHSQNSHGKAYHVYVIDFVCVASFGNSTVCFLTG